jgi:NAD(P)-dependent dehydrogenase (short-subunit alcohol dehydrogenase family)
MLLTGNVALITGGAGGIGKGIALKFAEEGASVAIADIREEVGNETVKEVIKKGVDGLFVQCDVTNNRQVQAMVKRTISTFGKVDILVNNAGIGPEPKPTEELSEEEWDRVQSTNLKSVFLFSKAIIPYMKEKRYGRIINIASLAAISPFGPVVHYSSSKAGVVMLTINLAQELAPFNICVNAILPATVDTDMQNNRIPPDMSREEFLAIRGKAIPMGRVATPEDVAKVALFFASDLSSYVTASQVLVAGGLPYGVTTA